MQENTTKGVILYVNFFFNTIRWTQQRKGDSNFGVNWSKYPADIVLTEYPNSIE